MKDNNMIALAEIRNSYSLKKYGNLISEQIALLKYDDLCISIIEENEELNKQYCNRTDCFGRIKESKQYDNLVQKVENQQKEFIEWLENLINNANKVLDNPKEDEEIKSYI